MDISTKNLDEIQDLSLELYGRYDLDKSLLWFVEEVGELIAAIRKGKERSEVVGELGDAFAWLVCLSNILDIDLKEALQITMDKEAARQMRVYGRLKYTEKALLLARQA
jgi:NTP pyrophosphatase (non-canonical NTP hydrolase)